MGSQISPWSLCAFADDFSAFYIHVSRLGKHTADMETDPRQPAHHRADDRRPDPQTLARSIRERRRCFATRSSYAQVKKIYLERSRSGTIIQFGRFQSLEDHAKQVEDLVQDLLAPSIWRRKRWKSFRAKHLNHSFSKAYSIARITPAISFITWLFQNLLNSE
jgi:hypothetical protein